MAKSILRYEVKPAQDVPGGYFVEAIDYDDEGQCYRAMFYGPKAKERAEEYATLKNAGVLVAS